MSLIDELGIEGAYLAGLPLSRKSVIWIVGAFKGKTARLLTEAFDAPLIRCFDPQPHAIEHLRALAEEHPNVIVEPYALGPHNGSFRMREVGNDAASFHIDFERESEEIEGPMVDIAGMWAGDSLDLMIINCEGTEWWLLPRMKTIGMLPAIERLLVQFHTEACPSYEVQRRAREAMTGDHRIVLDEYPSWVAFERLGGV